MITRIVTIFLRRLWVDPSFSLLVRPPYGCFVFSGRFLLRTLSILLLVFVPLLLNLEFLYFLLVTVLTELLLKSLVICVITIFYRTEVTSPEVPE